MPPLTVDEWHKIRALQVGDKVTRMLGGVVPMPMVVTEVTDTTVVCGAWTFSRRNGAELDPDLGWDDEQTGSYIVPF